VLKVPLHPNQSIISLTLAFHTVAIVYCLGSSWSDSGAGTNLKVGAPIQREGPEFFLVVPLHFLAIKAQLVVLVSAFVMVSTVRSVSCLLFFYSRCPTVPSHL